MEAKVIVAKSNIDNKDYFFVFVEETPIRAFIDQNKAIEKVKAIDENEFLQSYFGSLSEEYKQKQKLSFAKLYKS